MQEDKLVELLGTVLPREQAAELASKAARSVTRSDGETAFVELLDELHGTSAKLGKLAIEMLPELDRRCGLAEVVLWLDLGVALAGSSGAAAMKYFKESALILGLIEPPAARSSVLALSLELADGDPNVALEFLRHVPELLTVQTLESLPSWAEVGLELARFDYVLGIEFVRQCPSVARVLPVDDVRTWVAFGTKLITQNSLGKRDYVGTLEFFRTSPMVLGEVEDTPVRAKVLEVGSLLADRDPVVAIAFLAAAPELAARLPSEAWRLRMLRYAALVAERDAEAALAYVRRCPDIIALLGDSALADEKFGEWFRSGMEILEYSTEGARAYFSLETQKALASVEQAMSGVPLRQMARQLKLFAQGLCATEVTIQALPGSPLDQSTRGMRATVTTDGLTILLPDLVRRYSTKEENARFYTIMVAHEAGHLEFGTYCLSLEGLGDLARDVLARYRPSEPFQVSMATVRTLNDLFSLYPQPGLIRDLWTILEDARIEYRLQTEYPGLRRELAAAAGEAATSRSLTHGLSVREMIVDYLLLLTTQERGSVEVPEAIAEIVDASWRLCQPIFTVTATAEEAVRIADQLYLLLDQMGSPFIQDPASTEQEPEGDHGAGPNASETMSGEYRPVTNWAYRGAMQPESIGSGDGLSAASDGEEGSTGSDIATAQDVGDMPAAANEERLREGLGYAVGPSPGPAPAGQDVPSMADLPGQSAGRRPTDQGVFYDEWDGTIRDYRSGWCRVVERYAEEGASAFVDETLGVHGAGVRLLRRYFESLRPPAWRRVRGQEDGEEVDLDAAVCRIADRVAGAELSDRIYIRREKRDRDVAAAFLVDLSGSTSRQIEESGRRVIDVEKEGLVLLCEALGAIGDQYAIYGYSGRGRHDVEFWIIKDFDEASAGRVARRLGSVSPLQQNRDGAAIRHATMKLLRRAAKTKLLMLISDGKPLDDGYADEYALEDTKMALREARLRGIEPFCITVDREANDYLRRMYGDVRFLIIDRASALPERLPRVYQRLTT